MPFARIDLIEGKAPDYRAAVADIVYRGILDVLKAPDGVTAVTIAIKILMVIAKRFGIASSTGVVMAGRKSPMTSLSLALDDHPSFD